MRRAAILCLVLTWIAPMAWGDEVKPSRKKAAAELLEVMGAAQTSMTAAKGFAEAELQANPLMEAYRDVLMKGIEKALSWELLGPRMIDIYAEAYTEEELRELIAFYKTPLGRKTLEKMPILTQQGAQAGRDLIEENQAELQEMLAARQRELGVAPAAEPDPETSLERANRLYDEEKWAEARDSYLLHLQTNPQDSGARSDLGGCYRALGAQKEALEEFDRVLAADPAHWPALYNKITVLGFDLKRKAEAVALLPRLREIRPDDAAVEALAISLGEK